MATKIKRKPLNANIAIIDGSLLAFRAAAGGEKRSIIAKHRASQREMPFDNRTAFKTYIENTNQKRIDEAKTKWKMTDFEIIDVIKPPDIAISIRNAQSLLQSILSVCQAEDYIIYVDEGKTFRHELATMMEYKGNRTGKPKPANLQAVKDWLVVHQNAKVVNELEADDYINMHQFEGWQRTKDGEPYTYISVTFDKDAMTCPGWVYDYRKDDNQKPLMEKPIFIDGFGEIHWRVKQKDCKGWGRKFFYYQLLYGDDADNYKSYKVAKTKFGEKSAYDVLSPLTNDKDCLQAVVDHYKKWYGQTEKFKYISWDKKEMEKTWLELLSEVFLLAYMRRHEKDVPDIAQILKNVGVEV